MINFSMCVLMITLLLHLTAAHWFATLLFLLSLIIFLVLIELKLDD